ncbi:MAG: radical SAM protein [Chloroflexi bacterium]|nr:radical SAM protein [Chloroflexota bacterium]
MPIVELKTLDGHRLLINTRSQATSIMVNDDLVLNYDPEGRMTGAWVEGRNYRRSLDNHIMVKQEGPRRGLSYRVRRELEPEEARQFLARAYGRVAEYREEARRSCALTTGRASAAEWQAVYDALDRILECDLPQLEREAEAFHNIYKPINILPPDQYLALVLQATEGCSYNQCAFCGFYRDRAFRIKSLDEFKQHIRDVRAFFGQALRVRKAIFLADANALVIPQAQLLAILDVINAEFAIEPRGLDRTALRAWRAEHPNFFEGVYSFIDAFTSRRKTAQDFHEMAQRGLRRVYIGLESGDGELLKFMGKPNSPQDVAQLVGQVKAGGVAVGLVILAGAGGDTFAAQHVQRTTELVNTLPLDSGDLIYFSELVDYPGSQYSALAREADIQPLAIDEIEQQIKQLRAGFRFNDKEHTPKISYYDVREFIY